VPILGLIVEGEWDIEAISVFSGRICGPGLDLRPRLCRGSVQGRFPQILKELAATAHPDRVVVVSDAHGRDHQTLASDLAREISRQRFQFPVHFVVIVQELEALFLADPRAIESVCSRRGTPIPSLGNLTETPENMPDPKSRLEALNNWCPSFKRLRAALQSE
jgi:hypothetical protein